MSDMWVVSNPPHADLTPVDTVPVIGVNGASMQRFSTKYGKLFLRVIEKDGFAYWMRLHKGVD